MVASNERSTCDPETLTPGRHRVGDLRHISVYRVILEAAGKGPPTEVALLQTLDIDI